MKSENTKNYISAKAMFSATGNKSEKSKNYISTNAMFLMMAIFFIATSYALRFANVPFKGILLITQYGTILLPSVLFLKYRGHNLKDALRLKKVSFKVLMISLLITFLALPIAYTLNFIMTITLAQFDWLAYSSLPLGSGGINYLIIIFLMSVTPGICEEIFFRGMVLNGYEKVFTPGKTIILTGFLFGLFHFNLQNFLLPAFLGMIFAWLVMTTGSIYTSILGHAAFNAIGVSLNYFSKTVTEDQFIESTDTMKGLPQEIIIVIVVMFGISVVCGIFLILAMTWLKKMCYQVKVGDQIQIQGHNLEVLLIEEKHLLVSNNGEEKRISKSTLSNRSHRYIEKVKEKPIKYKSPMINYILLGLVVGIYVYFEIIPRVFMK